MSEVLSPEGAGHASLSGRKRIMVVGSGGAGKTTFAIKLREITGLPVIHLDRHNWKPGWVPTPQAEWKEIVRNLAATDEWIIDGNYGGTLGIRARRCDMIIFFDFNRLVSLWGAVKRATLQRGRMRPDISEGCPERLNAAFLRWIWSYNKLSRPKVVGAIEEALEGTAIVTLRNRREVRTFLRDPSVVGPLNRN
jgi:adenylate kinase family enzyme